MEGDEVRGIGPLAESRWLRMDLDIRDGVEDGPAEVVEVFVDCGWDAVVDCALFAIAAALAIS